MNQKLSILRKHKKTESSLNAASKETQESNNVPNGFIRKSIERGIPYFLVIGFLLIVFVLFGDHFVPAKDVEIISVFTKEADSDSEFVESTQASLTKVEPKVLFQASGWFEADPYPYRATTLISGFIKDVFVLEGQNVKKGDLLATMVDDDALIDLKAAKYHVKKAEAVIDAQDFSIIQTKAEVESLHAQINAANARLAELDDIARRMIKLADGAVPEQEITQALLRQKTQQALVESLKSNLGQLNAIIDKQIQEKNSYKASLDIAKMDLERKQLAYDRTRITAPIDGIVQALHAAPGQKKIAGSDNMESMTIAVIFDPGSLQARIDVPLEEAGKLSIGQPVLVKTSYLSSKTFNGRVSRLLGESDIQRNTLQAKVEIMDPDSGLRPEMLCRAEFLASKDHVKLTSDNRYVVLASKTTLMDIQGNRATVFRLAKDRRFIEKVNVTISETKDPGYYQILEGVNSGDKLINNPTADLKHHQRVNPISV